LKHLTLAVGTYESVPLFGSLVNDGLKVLKAALLSHVLLTKRPFSATSSSSMLITGHHTQLTVVRFVHKAYKSPLGANYASRIARKQLGIANSGARLTFILEESRY